MTEDVRTDSGLGEKEGMEIRRKAELYTLYEKPQDGIRYDSPEVLFMQYIAQGKADDALSLFPEQRQFTGALPAVDAPYGRFEGKAQILSFAEGFIRRFEAEG